MNEPLKLAMEVSRPPAEALPDPRDGILKSQSEAESSDGNALESALSGEAQAGSRMNPEKRQAAANKSQALRPLA